MAYFVVGLIIGLVVGWAIPQPAFVKDYEAKFFRWLFAFSASKVNETVANNPPTGNNAPNT